MADTKFFHPMEVRYGDLDPQGHLNNAKYLTYFEQARVQYFEELGLFSKDQSFMDIGVIIADIHIQYEAPVFLGAAIKVGVRTVNIGNKSITIEQTILERPARRSTPTARSSLWPMIITAIKPLPYLKNGGRKSRNSKGQ